MVSLGYRSVSLSSREGATREGYGVFWKVMTVPDHQLDEEWVIVEIDGDFTVLARHSACVAEPERITVEVMTQLEEHHCPAMPVSA